MMEYECDGSAYISFIFYLRYLFILFIASVLEIYLLHYHCYLEKNINNFFKEM